MKRAHCIVAACLALLAPASGFAQPDAYPSRPVKLLVGYPPGGASDTISRIVGAELSKLNGQSFVIENRPGVGGMLAMGMVAKAPADGYTLGLAVSGTLTTGPHLQSAKLYDPLNDFESVGMVAKAPMVLLAGPAAGYDNVDAVVRDARKRPGQLMFASGAQAFELALQLFKTKAGVDITTVSYQGGAPASIDVMSGRAQLMVDTIGAQQENIKAGKLKALAVLDSTRSPIAPDVPTMAEAGVKGYEALGWTALVAPKGTPPAVVQKLNTQLQEVLKMPQVKQKLDALAFEPWPSTPQFMQKTVAAEYAKWGEVVRVSGMKAK
ncbi:tripartite tricarboxylate transporter substrate binding protein [Cupriavidus pauculus]|uniref:Bug family tripartite tricarboxylate transporter substrate binding protein n=1 Tax=Cupriavidus pauculus TaxID=82633 RepID=UPI001EE230AB|nr:tripartite tricarboxylate transporter substrate binding protein [Cupriavidus pauculus]GJG98641.1 tripartite tricarboxylate transporter substrate binding protein [Cupriavidus pauculus]